MTIRSAIPLRAARLALDEAVTQLYRSLHSGQAESGGAGTDGELLAERTRAHLLRIQDALGYWGECRDYHDAALRAAGELLSGFHDKEKT